MCRKTVCHFGSQKRPVTVYELPWRTPLAVLHLSATTKTMYMTAARFALCSAKCCQFCEESPATTFRRWELCGVRCSQHLNVVAEDSSQNWRHFTLMCAPSRSLLPAPPSLYTTNCLLFRDLVCW